MATLRTRRFAEVDRLKSISPPQLLALLRPYADYLGQRGVGLPSPGDNLDLVALSRVLMNPDEGMPLRLVDALYLINELATAEGMDALVDAVSDKGWHLDAGPAATPADVAVEVWLKRPRLLEEQHAENLVTRPRSFEHFLGEAGAAQPITPAESARHDALERDLNNWFNANRRGRGCKVFRFGDGDSIWVLIRHGMPVKREGSLRDGEPASVFYRPEKHDVVVYDGDRDELGINAATRKEKDLYRELIGMYLFDRSGYFSGEGKYTLDPLKFDGAAALVCSDVDGLKRITLVELEFWHGGEFGETEIRKARDVFAALASRKRVIPLMHGFRGQCSRSSSPTHRDHAR